MILTGTLNTALEKVLFINEWESGPPMRTAKIVTSVGGKGLDSSVVLHHHHHSDIIAGLLSISPVHCEQLLVKFKQKVTGACYVICAGSIPSSLPADFYCRMEDILRILPETNLKSLAI
jgi:fructose-1-phosphate kinase PfkB-like protein